MAARRSRRRRAKGTGSVSFDKGKRKWVARLPDTGISEPPKRLFDTEDEAEDWLDQRLRDTADGIAVTDIPTVAQWADHWLNHIVKVKATTHKEYADTIRLRIVPLLGSIRLNELTYEKVEVWLSHLTSRYAYHSVRNAFRLLRAMLAVSVARDKIRKNPTDTVKLPRSEDDEDERAGYALNPDEARRFLDAVSGHRLYPLYYVALRTGMRKSELIGLRRPNLHLDGPEPYIHVREQISTIGKKRVTTKPKTKQSIRKIPIDAEIVAVLRDALAALAEERQRLGDAWHEQMLVFPSSVGTPLGESNLHVHFKAVLKQANLPDIRFHDLRHTAGSLMMRQRGDRSLADVSKILGHATITTTARLYIHSYDDTMRAAVSSTSELLPARKVG